MEKRSNGWISSQLEGPSKTPSVNISRVWETGAWGIPRKTETFHSSSDASLFSSSLPVLPHEKLHFADAEHSGHSVDDNSPELCRLELKNGGKDPLKDDETNALRSLLPGDEDDLLAGIMDDFDLSELPSQLEDLEEYDVFGTGGGMELDFEPQDSLSIGMSKMNLSEGVLANGIGHYPLPNGVGMVAGEHPYGEHPSRTLFVRNINSNAEETELRSLFEQYGDIRTLYTACKHRGFVMISYYDIRAARTAMRALQNKPLRRRKLDIHFSIPKDNPSEKDINQGTLVVFNLDPSVSNDDLRQIFGAYGEVKEIRETPHKRHHKFIEFYDVRAAEAALKALNRSDIAGKCIKLEPSRPGGARRNLMQQLTQELEHDEARSFRHHIGSPVANSPPGNWAHFGSPVEQNPLHDFSKSPGLGSFSPVSNNNLPGLASILPPHVPNSPKIAPIGKDQRKSHNTNPIFSNTGAVQGVSYKHSRSFPEQKISASPGPISTFSESNSSSSGIGTLTGPQFLWGSPTLTLSVLVLLGQHHHNHHVGSAPSGVHLDRHFNYLSESPETSFMNPVPFAGVGLNHSNGSFLMNVGARGTIGAGLGTTGIEGLADRNQTRLVENNGNQIDNKKQYQLGLDKIINGEDTRTTLMIKNIPNKYTSKMLLAAIDENHQGTYDFLYLPIDFKNNCNVGYAFINMISPSHIVSFYQAFNGKKWEKFNSEKVASLAYARIQGKTALVAHFQNSSLMNEDKRCRPILFHSEGQETGDQEHFISSNLNIRIRQPDGSYSGDSLESPKGLLDEKPEIS
ncbi:Protein MEI2-like 5 [Hibiscus syriacus]|uniref:Protein MEI2-like 5 n=1 Tax=Hibiscus syriacus TaxID=106335 RepID=A0A6A3CZ68_HIBSY|nr:Protein MEI2-like 5 [Hibiscus syriacus]